MKRSGAWMAFAAGIFFLQAGYARQSFTYLDLIDRLCDMEFLATLPEPGETCRLWSSYDRASRYDPQTGKYINWDANGDGYGTVNWIRIEKGNFVFGEMEGPGCIWRIWSATALQGRVKIFLDGAADPAVDLPFEEYFNGAQPPFNRPALAYTVTNGENCYVPIPFQKSCKIVADKDYGQYYQFTYTLFPKGTVVPTFSRNLTAEENAALDKANDFFRHCGPNSFKSRPNQKTETFAVELAPGEKKDIALDGKQAILSLRVRPQLPTDVEGRRKALRELAMQIFWDNSEQPAVWCPLGDFFGTGPGVNLYRSLAMGMTEEGFYSNWYMPFEKKARIQLLNEGNQNRQMTLELTYAPHSMEASSYGRFHAKWHRDAFLPEEKERWIDWTLLKTEGRGRFCGVQLQIWNPRGGWWGEGDEKFFVDGEKFPSTFGTGSEDYFGYAWSDWVLFEKPFHNLTISEYNKGHISANRWHIADNVPFQTSFEGTIEKYFADSRPTQYAAAAYWYQAPGGNDPYLPVPPVERIDYYTRLSYPLDVAGILVLEEPEGNLEAQGMGSFTQDHWRNGEQLWWTGQLGAKLRIGLNIKHKGTYKIATRLTKAIDYGIVQFYLDGQKILESMDLYHPDGVIATGEINLGKFKLNKGQHILTVEIVGSNPKAVQRYMVGLDYVDVKRTLF